MADHDKFHRHFGCERILHEDDASSCLVEPRLTGTKAVALDDEIRLIPVPGHTPGSACLLFRERYLFSGDHLSVASGGRELRASRRTCWHSWTEQTRSMERLAEATFEWVLPGHGERGRFPPERMKTEMGRLLRSMGSGRSG